MSAGRLARAGGQSLLLYVAQRTLTTDFTQVSRLQFPKLRTRVQFSSPAPSFTDWSFDP
jgi:hypothetical protein